VFAALAACLVACGLGSVGGPQVAVAAPGGQPVTILVNSADFGGPDTNPGDGVCDAGGTVVVAGETKARCTLRAAIEEANALSSSMGATNGDEVLVTLDPGFVGGTIAGDNTSSANFMQTTAASDIATGAVWFAVTAPMTIDLKDALHTDTAAAAAPSYASTVFAITGANVTVKNASGILGGDTSFVIGGAASGVVLDGGTTYQSKNNYAKRFVVVNNGAAGVTLRNYRVGGLGSVLSANAALVPTYGALVFTPAGQASATTRNVLVDGVDFTSPQTSAPSSATCAANNGAGCVNTAVALNAGARLNGFELRGSTVKNLKGYVNGSSTVTQIFNAYNVRVDQAVSNLNIHDNTFTNNSTYAALNQALLTALIMLPTYQTTGVAVGLGGTNTIANNRFDNSGTTTQAYAIGWDPEITATTRASGLTIADNYFDGFQTAAILLKSAGLVSVERNTFGPKSASASPTANEPTADNVSYNASTAPNSSATGLFMGLSNTNQRIRTWTPVSASLTSACQVSFTAQQTLALPMPARVDVYWTATSKAEKYLGSVSVASGTSTPVKVWLPSAAVTGGKGSGFVRLQTQTWGTGGAYAQASSSQFSGILAVPATACTPPVLKAATISRTHGPASGGGTLTVAGQGFDVAAPSVVFQAGGNAVPCADVAVASGTELTCTIPASPLPGDGTGSADVVVSAGGQVIGTFAGGYTYYRSTLTAPDRADGPIEGGGCSVRGSGLVTLIDGVRFDGASWVDAGVGAGATLDLSAGFLADTPGDSPGLGLVGLGGDAGGGGSLFRGVVFGLRLWDGGTLVRDLQPAAWTAGGVTVYGFQDALSGALFANDGTGALGGADRLGRAWAVEPTTVIHGGPVAQASVTVTSATALTYACPPHASGRVDVGATVDGIATNTLAGAYLHWVDGDLAVAVRGWTNAEGLTYDQIIGTPDHGGAVEVPTGGALPSGTTIWWTYTVTYSHRDPVTGQPSGTGQPGVTGVTVTDSVLQVVCTVDVPVNTPVGCVGSGEVGAR